FLVGIMKLCPQTEACKLETELFSKYRRSKRLLTTQELEVLKQIQVERKVAKLFYQNATLTKDQWTSAPYEVVFPASRTIVDKEIASTKHKRVEIADDAIAVD